MYSDVLVIGSGIAGLSYAIELAEQRPDLNIVIISKREVFESTTKYAQGGIAVVQNFVSDSFDKHVNDTLLAGDFTGDQQVVRKVVKEGPSRLKRLMNWGAQFDQVSDQNSRLDLGKEGGHTANRIVHHKDKSGFEIQRALVQRLKEIKNISLLENHTLVDLITDHHHNMTARNRCYGAYVISLQTLSIVKISAQITVLSTGGAGQVYKYTTNPESATGDGIAAAYRAKVRVKNLHYVQFHPTALALENQKSPFLISEAVRGFGAHLLNEKKERFMLNYDSRGELSSRDIVSRAIEKEIKKQELPHVFLSLKHLDKLEVENAFPTISKECKKHGLFFHKDLIPVRPAAHYFCGGIAVDIDANTSLDGLLAIGECSHTGLHGANRLASNSLLEALVYAHTAVKTTQATLEQKWLEKDYLNQIPQWSHPQEILDRYSEKISNLKLGVQQIMSSKVGVFKSNKGLIEAEQELDYYYQSTKKYYQQNKITPQLLELRNLVNVSYLIIKQAQQTKENKGVYYNEDYA
ncbi:MAG: L-aspartate oxidase [Flavobacteriaceae bacterium]